MTVNEAVQAVARRLSEVLTDSGVSVQLSKTSSLQPVTGEYLVAPDGRINLRQYGTLSISGKTVAEARQAIESHLANYLTDPKVSVEVRAFNSQYFYVILDGAGMGDNVRRLPITGNETVLDAVAAVNGISQLSSKKMWIARPTPGNPEKGTVLPVDYLAITQQGATATNYQLLPGDRLFIEGDPLIALNNELGKRTAPIERTLGLLGLETSTFNARRNYAPNVKPDKQEADLTEALQRYLKELTPLLEKK
jgi:polysaccharide export outer membrane protein